MALREPASLADSRGRARSRPQWSRDASERARGFEPGRTGLFQFCAAAAAATIAQKPLTHRGDQLIWVDGVCVCGVLSMCSFSGTKACFYRK